MASQKIEASIVFCIIFCTNAWNGLSNYLYQHLASVFQINISYTGFNWLPHRAFAINYDIHMQVLFDGENKFHVPTKTYIKY